MANPFDTTQARRFYDPYRQYSEVLGRSLGPAKVDRVKISTGKRGKPELLGGVSNLQIGEDNVRLPNAVLQQMLYGMGVNKGRVGGNNFIAGGGTPERPYTSHASLQGLINQFFPKESRAWLEGRPLSQMDEPEFERRALQRETNELTAQPLQETLTTGGQTVGDSGVQRMAALRKRMRNVPEVNPRLAAARRADAERPVHQLLTRMQAYRPTTSNLRISEKVIA